MGLFDIFKKNNNTIKTTMPVQERKPFDVNYTYNKNGNLQVDFQDNDSRITLGQFYDVTRLIICDENVELAGHKLCRCYVSWYGSTDAQYFDPIIEEQSRRNRYQEILVEINVEQMKNNPQYLVMLMRGLLKQSRVEEYLSKGLQDRPDRPCGKYIGGIQETQNGYGKIFNQTIGNVAHNMSEMRVKRAQYKKMEEARRAAEISYMQERIAQLQAKIDEMSK